MTPLQAVIMIPFYSSLTVSMREYGHLTMVVLKLIGDLAFAQIMIIIFMQPEKLQALTFQHKQSRVLIIKLH
ncbi:MAG: hypothetical protein DRQ01_07050 [Ignavibacteriae bacterium]|nr:MAG: hypothetical protein DRQ01_07050 [Ignavibacteriota bacterium]